MELLPHWLCRVTCCDTVGERTVFSGGSPLTGRGRVQGTGSRQEQPRFGGVFRLCASGLGTAVIVLLPVTVILKLSPQQPQPSEAGFLPHPAVGLFVSVSRFLGNYGHDQVKPHSLERFPNATQRVTLPMTGVEVLIRRLDVEAFTSEGVRTALNMPALR